MPEATAQSELPAATGATPAARAGAGAMRTAVETVRDGASAVINAGTEGATVVADAAGDAAKSWGDSIREDGLIQGTWNFFKNMGSSTAGGIGGAISNFFRGTNHGGLIGGVLGVGLAWLASTMFGGGLVGTAATVLLAPAGFLMGRDFGNSTINPILSNLFGGHGNQQQAAAETGTPAHTPETPAVTASAPTTAQAPTTGQNPITGATLQVHQSYAEARAALANVSYDPSGPLALTNDPSDQALGHILVQASQAAPTATPISMTASTVSVGSVQTPASAPAPAPSSGPSAARYAL